MYYTPNIFFKKNWCIKLLYFVCQSIKEIIYMVHIRDTTLINYENSRDNQTQPITEISLLKKVTKK